MVIRDVGRVLGLFGFIGISKMIPLIPLDREPTECIASEPRLQKLINEDPRIKLIDLSLKLEGLNRNVPLAAGSYCR